jgi:lysophospholipase L1-like esterase
MANINVTVQGGQAIRVDVGENTLAAANSATAAASSATAAASSAAAAAASLSATTAQVPPTFPIFADDPLYGQAIEVDVNGRVVFGLGPDGTVYGQRGEVFPIFADDPLYGSNIAVNEDGVLIVGAGVARPAADKIIVMLGDSITANYNVPPLVAALTGATVHNFAWGGSRVSSGGAAFANSRSVAAIAAAVTSGDWTAIIAGVDAEEPTGDAFDVAERARVRAMAAFDWTTPDLIIILGGTNDWSAQVSLGSADSTTTTQFNGGLNESIRRFQEKRPAVQIALATPAWRGPLATLGDSNVNANGAGVFLSAFGDAIRANRWQLPVLDLARTLGINLGNKTLMLADDLHPTATGAARWAQRITTFINSLF